eukprot:scaffold138897_cov37-Attheya_sp.AAC.1
MSASHRFFGLENATTIHLKLEWDSRDSLQISLMACRGIPQGCHFRLPGRHRTWMLLTRRGFWVQRCQRLPNTRPFRTPSECADKGGI